MTGSALLRASNGARGPRLLLLSYHFPPGQGAGALRWEKLSAFAAERGWGVDVITADPGAHASVDRERLASLPATVGVLGVPVPGARPSAPVASRPAASVPAPAPVREPAEDLVWRRDMTWAVTLRSTLAAVRAWRAFRAEHAWAAAAVEAARERAGRDHRAVVSCGPPHMVHVAGLGLARSLGLPLVMDMRDPWSLAPATLREVGSPVWYTLAERYERRAVSGSALVVANTQPSADALARAYPHAADRIIAVQNGYDEDDPLPDFQPSDRFLVAYAGTIYIDRDPRPFLRAAAAVVRELAIAPDRFGLSFVGHAGSFGGADLRELARQAGLAEEYLAIHPRMPRRAALAMLGQASLLLSLPQGVDLSVPSKVYEYMRFPAWLLALAVRGSATEMLLRDTEADVVAPDDEEGLRRVLRARYLAWARGERPLPIARDGVFSRRRQAAHLFDAMEARVAGLRAVECAA